MRANTVSVCECVCVHVCEIEGVVCECVCACACVHVCEIEAGGGV